MNTNSYDPRARWMAAGRSCVAAALLAIPTICLSPTFARPEAADVAAAAVTQALLLPIPLRLDDDAIARSLPVASADTDADAGAMLARTHASGGIADDAAMISGIAATPMSSGVPASDGSPVGTAAEAPAGGACGNCGTPGAGGGGTAGAYSLLNAAALASAGATGGGMPPESTAIDPATSQGAATGLMPPGTAQPPVILANNSVGNRPGYAGDSRSDTVSNAKSPSGLGGGDATPGVAPPATSSPPGTWSPPTGGITSPPFTSNPGHGKPETGDAPPVNGGPITGGEPIAGGGPIVGGGPIDGGPIGGGGGGGRGWNPPPGGGNTVTLPVVPVSSQQPGDGYVAPPGFDGPVFGAPPGGNTLVLRLDAPVAFVPEPDTLMLLVAALVALAFARYAPRRK